MIFGLEIPLKFNSTIDGLISPQVKLTAAIFIKFDKRILCQLH